MWVDDQWSINVCQYLKPTGTEAFSPRDVLRKIPDYRINAYQLLSPTQASIYNIILPLSNPIAILDGECASGVESGHAVYSPKHSCSACVPATLIKTYLDNL